MITRYIIVNPQDHVLCGFHYVDHKMTPKWRHPGHPEGLAPSTYASLKEAAATLKDNPALLVDCRIGEVTFKLEV